MRIKDSLSGVAAVVAVAGLFFAGGGGSAFGQKTGAALPTNLTILSGAAARSLFKQCSRASPDAGSFWTPNPSDVQAAEQALPGFMQTQKGRPGPNRHLRSDYRQYAGYVSKASGHKCLYVNAFAPTVKERLERDTKNAKPPSKPFDWKREAMGVCDGGDNFWGVEYDTQTKKWSNLYFNGLG